jgi:sodium transport system permease protein
VAPAEKKTGFLLAMMLPYMIVLTVMLGAMYPAIDLTAGEKERGTLETILASPAGRNEVTLGKFFCVFTAAMVTVLLGATSMIVTSGFGFAQFANQEAESAAFVLSVNPASFVVVVILMIPTAVLLSAVLLAIAVMARSFKEAQGYVTPLMFAVIIPSMVAFMPGMELNATLAWVPISNIALGVKAALLTAKGEGFPWPLFGIVFLSTAVYATFALFLVRQMFNKESVLFRT